MKIARLTQEQALALEAALKKESADAILKSAAREWETWLNDCSPLNYLDLPTLAKALYAGYEVGEAFKPGDEIMTNFSTQKFFVIKNKMPMQAKAWEFEGGNWDYESNIRHATAEEIYWFKTLGRNRVGDIRIGDVYHDDEGGRWNVYDGVLVDRVKEMFKVNNFSGITPCESFKPFLKDEI